MINMAISVFVSNLFLMAILYLWVTKPKCTGDYKCLNCKFIEHATALHGPHKKAKDKKERMGFR